MTRGYRQDVIAFLVIGTVIAGVMLSARPLPVPPPIATASTPTPEVPDSSSGPDLGSLHEDIGSVLVVSWRGTAMSPRAAFLVG